MEGAQHFPVLVADAQVGCVPGVEGEFQFAIAVVDQEIGHHVVGGPVAAAGETAGRLGIEFQDLVNGIPQVFFVNIELAAKFGVVFFGKFLEVLVDNANGNLYHQLVFVRQQVLVLAEAMLKL